MLVFRAKHSSGARVLAPLVGRQSNRPFRGRAIVEAIASEIATRAPTPARLGTAQSRRDATNARNDSALSQPNPLAIEAR
jgi:hypothetical protein